ncbi:MAG: flagellar type III secretion system protein FlhB [Pseudomonadota bacterium]
MSEEDQAAEKSFDPTPKRLEEARKKGDVPKSTDLNVSASFLGLLLAVVLAEQFGFVEFASRLAVMFQDADKLAKLAFGSGGTWFVGTLLSQLTLGLLAFFAIPILFVLLSLVAQRAIVFAPDKLNFKLNRISPISGAKNKFGANGLFEFAKSAAKLSLVSLLLTYFVYVNLDRLMESLSFTSGGLVLLAKDLLAEFLLLVFVLSLLIGGVDFLWQSAEHIRKNRMSRKDIEDETKQSEGDPQFKQTRRQRAYDIAMNQMLADVPGADVVIVNPTHYAVALRWDRGSGGAPVCVAKGVDEIAARIREVATDAQVPIKSDPPTARALFATVEIGQEIHEEHYRSVAIAIRFAEDIRRKARRNGRSGE